MVILQKKCASTLFFENRHYILAIYNMSDLVVRYSFETTEINGTTLSNASYGGKILNATMSAAGMVSSSVYLVGTQSLALSGTNFVSLPNITDLGNTLTISVWVYPTTATGIQRVVELASTSNLTYTISYTSSNTFVFGVGLSSYTFPNQTFPINQWTHVCWVISPTNWRILINNMPTVATLANSSGTFPGTVVGASSFLGKSGVGNNAFVGYLDDFRLYQVALTDDQIYEIYDTATYLNYYRFETGDIDTSNPAQITLANLASGRPILDATVNTVSIANQKYGTSAFNLSTTVFKSGLSSLYSNGTSGNNVYLPTIPNINSAGFSVAVWFNTQGAGSATQVVCSLGGNNIHWKIIHNTSTNSLIFAQYRTTNNASPVLVGWLQTSNTYPSGYLIGNNTTPAYLRYGGLASTNNWQHVCWTITPTYWKIQINGQVNVLSSSTAYMSTNNTMSSVLTTIPPILNVNTLFMSPYVGTTLNGYIDDIRIYNRPLTDGEMSKLYNYRCLRTNYYTPEGVDMINQFASGSSSGISVDFETETNENITSVFQSFTPSVAVEQLNVYAHLYDPTTLHIAETVSTSANPVRTISNVVAGQIIASSAVSGLPYITAIDTNANTITLNKPSGTSSGVAGYAYAGAFYVANGLMTLYVDNTTLRSFGGNSPEVNQLVYHSDIPVGTYIRAIYEYGNLAGSITTFDNLSFNSPGIAANTYSMVASPYTAIPNWTITATNCDIYLANQSTYWGYGTLPSGISQWLVVQSKGEGSSATISRTFYSNTNSNYSVGFYSYLKHTDPTVSTNTISATLGNRSTGRLFNGINQWTQNTLDCAVVDGSNTLVFDILFDVSNGSAVYLSGVSLSLGASSASITGNANNTKMYNLLLSNSTVNIPLSNTENMSWRSVQPTSFYTPVEFSRLSGYNLLTGPDKYDDYVYQFSNQNYSALPFIATGSYTTTDLQNGYYVVQFTDYGTIRFLSEGSNLQLLVVGGGGAGARSRSVVVNGSTVAVGGGGGEGGQVLYYSNYSVLPSNIYTVEVGNGGDVSSATNAGQNGSPSRFGSEVAAGGAGGSSGSAALVSGVVVYTAGTGGTGLTNGGNGGNGGNAANVEGQAGSAGVSVVFGANTNAIFYGGGGGGGSNQASNPTSANGGSGGGGASGVDGTAGLGAGGGGAHANSSAIGKGGKGTVLVYIGTTPGAPTSLYAAEITNTTITVAFGAPRRTVSQYIANIRASGSNTTLTQTFSPSATTYTITGLLQNTTYTIFITATNTIGSSISNIITVTTKRTMDTKPVVSILSGSNTSITTAIGKSDVNVVSYSGYLKALYSTYTTNTYSTPSTTLRFSNLTRDTWYIYYVSGRTSYGTTDTASVLIKTKNLLDPVSTVQIGTRTGSTIDISFNRPTLFNGLKPLIYYSFDVQTADNTALANLATGVSVYDASLSTGTIGDTYVYGNGGLSLSSSNTSGVPCFINRSINFANYSAITISFWIYVRRYYVGIFDARPMWLFTFNNNAASNNIIYGLRFTSNGIYTLYCSNRTYSITGTFTNFSTWTHITIVQTISTSPTGTGTLQFYINGGLRHTNTNVNTYNANMLATRNYIASNNDGNALYDGHIDDFRIYETALTASQIGGVITNTISLITPLTKYKLYYASITSYSKSSMLFMYIALVYYIQSSKIYNLRTDTPVLDGILVNNPGISQTADQYELTLSATNYQCVQFPTFTLGTIGFSFGCWFRSNANPDGTRLLDMSAPDGTNTNNHTIFLEINGGGKLYYGLTHTGTKYLISATNVNTNTYTHIVLVVGLPNLSTNTCTVRAYLNGVLVYTGNSIPYPANVSRSLCFVGKSNATDAFWNGGVYDLLAWSREITAAEASFLFNSSGLVVSSVDIPDTTSTTVSTTVQNLIPRRRYSMVVSTVNDDGETYSVPFTAYTQNVPYSPEDFEIYDLTNVSVSFRFTPPDQIINYYTLSIKQYPSLTDVVDISGESGPFSYSQFTKNTQYIAYLNAVNNDGISPTVSLIFTTLKEPEAPTNFALTNIGNSFVSFSFTTATGYNVLGYDVSATPIFGGSVGYATLDASATSYTLSGLEGGITYLLGISARNIFGNSPTTSLNFETTYVTDKPANLAVASTTDTTLTISFGPPAQPFNYYAIYLRNQTPNLFRNIGFTAYTTPVIQPADVVGFAISATGTTRIAVFGTNTGLYYTRVLNGVWGTVRAVSVSHSATPAMNAITAVALSADGTRVVLVYGLSRVYWGDTTGLLAGNANTLYLTAIQDTASRMCYGVALSADKQRILATEYNGYVYFADWLGTNYGILTRTLDTAVRKYAGVDISSDKNKIVYSGDTNIYWAWWNGTNYLGGTAIAGSGVSGSLALGVCYLSRDVDMLVVSSLSGRPQYTVWSDTNYVALQDVSAAALPVAKGYNITSDGSGNIYYAPFGDTNLYTTRITYEKYRQLQNVSYFSNSLTTYTVSGLYKNIVYDVSLSTFNVYGESAYATTSGTTKNPPDAVSGLSVSTTGIVSFYKPYQSVVSYIVALNTSNTSTGAIATQTPTTPSATFTGLTVSQTYYVFVKAANADGISSETSTSFIPTEETRDLQAGNGVFTTIPNVNSCGCLYACKWVNNQYWGPIIRLRRSNDNTEQDFYIDASGTKVGTTLGGNGTAVATWLNGSTAYVVVWYDQSKAGRLTTNNNATQTTASAQPTFDITNKTIVFTNTTTLVITTMPLTAGNVAYTIFTKIGNTANLGNTTFMTIGNRNTFQNVAIVFSSTRQPQHNWFGAQWITPVSITDNTKMTIAYDLSKRYVYLNGTEYSTNSTGHNQTNGPSEIGWKNFIGSVHHFWVYNTTFTSADRIQCETI